MPRAGLVQKLPNSDKSPLSLGPAGALSSDNHSMFSKYFLVAVALSVVLLAVVAGSPAAHFKSICQEGRMAIG